MYVDISEHTEQASLAKLNNMCFQQNDIQRAFPSKGLPDMFANLPWLCCVSAGGIRKNNHRVKMAGK